MPARGLARDWPAVHRLGTGATRCSAPFGCSGETNSSRMSGPNRGGCGGRCAQEERGVWWAQLLSLGLVSFILPAQPYHWERRALSGDLGGCSLRPATSRASRASRLKHCSLQRDVQRAFLKDRC